MAIQFESDGTLKFPNIKRIFLPDVGKEICDADLSGADIQIVAADSQCKWLLDFFSKSQEKKVYAYIASEFFQRDISDKSSEYKLYKGIFHGCLTGEHEVLTVNGRKKFEWKKLEEYNNNIPIAVWDKKTTKISYEIPIYFNKDFVDFSEDLIHIKGKNFEQIVTQDHKFHVRKRGSYHYEIKEAKDLTLDYCVANILDSFALGYKTYYTSIETIERLKHEGTKVYCPQTSKGFFIVKYKENIMVTGNTNYLMGVEKLALLAGIPINLARKLQEFYFHLNPEIKLWHKKLETDVRTYGYVFNKFGRKLEFLNLNDPLLMNKVCASIPQSTIGDVINRAWIKIIKKYPEIDVLMQTHDSLLVQYDIEKAEFYRKEIKKLMIINIPYNPILNISSDIKYSQVSYGDCK